MKTNTNFDLIDKNKIFYEIFLVVNFCIKKKAPYGVHWIFFNENFNKKDLGLDGHPKRGKNIPLLKGIKECLQELIYFLRKKFILKIK